MTKQIRIENADTSRWKVKVEVWEKGLAGDIKLREVDLDYPTQMVTEYIYKDHWVVIKENGERATT